MKTLLLWDSWQKTQLNHSECPQYLLQCDPVSKPTTIRDPSYLITTLANTWGKHDDEHTDKAAIKSSYYITQ